MTPIYQPPGSRVCGQACVASAASISLSKAIKIFGHSHSTTTRECIAALRSLGFSCADRCHRISRLRPTFPSRCLIHITRYSPLPRLSHWMLWWNGKMHDPEGYYPHGYEDWKITSYLEIYT